MTKAKPKQKQNEHKIEMNKILKNQKRKNSNKKK